MAGQAPGGVPRASAAAPREPQVHPAAVHIVAPEAAQIAVSADPGVPFAAADERLLVLVAAHTQVAAALGLSQQHLALTVDEIVT